MRDETRDALESLENDGRLLPSEVVAAAEDEASPLHDCFEWDDSKAAYQQRLGRARDLIVSFPAKITTIGTTLHCPATVVVTKQYIHDPSLPAHVEGYRRLEVLKNDPEMAAEAVRREIDSAAAHLRRAESIAEALGLASAVAAVKKKLVALRKRIKSTNKK